MEQAENAITENCDEDDRLRKVQIVSTERDDIS